MVLFFFAGESAEGALGRAACGKATAGAVELQRLGRYRREDDAFLKNPLAAFLYLRGSPCLLFFSGISVTPLIEVLKHLKT